MVDSNKLLIEKVLKLNKKIESTSKPLSKKSKRVIGNGLEEIFPIGSHVFLKSVKCTAVVIGYCHKPADDIGKIDDNRPLHVKIVSGNLDRYYRYVGTKMQCSLSVIEVMV